METLSRNSLRIVHVEDDPAFTEITELLLRNAGFEQSIVHFKDGIEALRHFSTMGLKQAPHVVLLDLHIPHIDGLEVLHWLRHGHATRDIPVYLLTSSDDPEDRRRAVEERVTGYFLKTPVLDEVIRNLDHQIEMINRRNIAGICPEHTSEEPFVLVGEDLYFESQDTFSG